MNTFARVAALLFIVSYCVASQEEDLENSPAEGSEEVPAKDQEYEALDALEKDGDHSAKQAITPASTAARTTSSLQTIDVVFVPFATGGGNEGKKNNFFIFITQRKVDKQKDFVPFHTRKKNVQRTTPTKDTTTASDTAGTGEEKPTKTSKSEVVSSTNKKSLPKSFIGLISLNIILSIFSIALNIILVHYRRKEGSGRSMVNVLYLRNGVADIFVGVGVLLQGPILCILLYRKGDLSGLTVPAYVIYCITAIAIKMSVFMNCVLGVVRCINIVRPFYHISNRALNICSLMYMALWVANVALDLWQFTAKIGTKNIMFVVRVLVLKGQPGFGLVLLTTEKGEHGASYSAHLMSYLIQFILPIALPTLLCFVLMIVQMRHLSKQQLTVSALVHQANTGPNAGKGPKRPSSGNRKASITICLVTIIYVCSSAVAIATWLIIDGRRGYLGSREKYESVMEEQRTAASWSDLAAIYFALSTCPLICSTLTPLTLLLRGSGTAFSSVRRLVSRISTASLLLP